MEGWTFEVDTDRQLVYLMSGGGLILAGVDQLRKQTIGLIVPNMSPEEYVSLMERAYIEGCQLRLEELGEGRVVAEPTSG